MRRNAVIYARYSSASQNESSIDQQLVVCYEYAKKNDIQIVGEYIDKALTGRNDDRPDFQRMLKDATKKQWEYIIVYKLDRFSRNRYDSAIHNKMLKKYGVKRLSATENISDAPEGILMESVLEGMAEYYSIELAQKINRGLDDNVRKGLMVGGSVTFGYDLVNKKLIPNDNASHVQYIFNAYAQGKTMDDIILELNAKGVQNVNGKAFSHQHISKILHNKRYIGTFTYKEKEYPDFIPPIIDMGLFNTVQERLTSYKNYGKRKTDVNFYLTGKLYCGHCGKTMGGASSTSRTNDKRHYYYVCTRKDKKPERKVNLEELVVSVLMQYVLKPENLDIIIDDIQDQVNKVDLVVSQEIEQLRKSIANTKKKLNHLMTAVKQGIFSPTLQSELATLESQIESYELEIQKKKITKHYNVDRDKIMYFFEQLYNRKTNEDTVGFIIRHFVKKVTVWDDGNLTIESNIMPEKDIKIEDYDEFRVRLNATQLHHLTRYSHPIGFVEPKVYIYHSTIFVRVKRLPN